MKIINVLLKNEEGGAFFQYFSSLSAMLAAISCGLHYGWPSPSLPKLLADDSDIPITDDEGFWLATMPLFGALIGSLTAAFLVDNIGRKRTILLTSIPYLLSWMMIIFSWNVPLLYAARFIAGIADGWTFSSIPMYVGEISQPSIRGFLASGISVSFILGILLINVIGSYLTIKITAMVVCVLPVALIICFIWMPESPYYLIMKNRHEDARRSLQTFIGPKLAILEMSRINLVVKEDMVQMKSGVFDLFTVKRNYRALLVMMLVRGTQQFSGSSAIVFYAQNIFDEAGSNLSADVASIIYFSIQVVLTIVSAGLVDRLGRRPLLLFSVIGAFFSLLIEGIYFYIKSLDSIDTTRFSLVPIIALICYIIFFSIGLQNIPILMLSEMFNQDVKALALCFADIYFAIIATAISKFFQISRDTFGMYMPFICFSIFCGIASILIYVFVPETKGKTLEEIQEYFKDTRTTKKKEKNIVI